TSLTASSLNSSVYRALVVFVTSVLLASIQPLSKGSGFRGQGQSAPAAAAAEKFSGSQRDPNRQTRPPPPNDP
ncbi:MAG: hypothetical protein AB1434_07340, partial [Pseudomonadota bacterium]